MTDLQTHLNKIRSDASECILLSSLATDGKGEVFARTAQHLNSLASELEKTIAENTARGTRVESVNVPPPALEEVLAPKVAGAQHRVAGSEVTIATDSPVERHQPDARPRRKLQWLLAVVFAGIVGVLFWVNKPANDYRPLFSALQSKLSTLQSRPETLPAPQDYTMPALATLLSDEHTGRKILMEQMSALTARLDSLATALDNFQTSSRQAAGLPSKVGAEEKSPPAELKSSGPDEKPAKLEEHRTPTLEGPAAEKQSGVRTGSPDSIDQVGTILVPRQAELDSHKLTIGPPGCTQFQSFDRVSGTYLTLSGRRRQCRQ